MERLLTDIQLADLAESPRAAVARRLEAGDRVGAVEVVERYEAALTGQMQRYDHWLAALFTFAGERHGPAGTSALVEATRDFFARWTAIGPVERGRPDSIAEAVANGAALDDFDAADRRWRAVVDLHRDWISALLSSIYDHHGVDEVEAAHRFVGVATMQNLLSGLHDPPVERLERLVWLLKGHFAEVRLVEEESRFCIVQDPCGTCGRQARDGRYGPPIDLAVVTERHPITWNLGATTIYRTHVPVWHVLMASEVLGVPWPVNRCPRSPDDGPCTILLYKDPLDPAAWEAVPGNLGTTTAS